MESLGDSINCDEGFIRQEVLNFLTWGGNNRSKHDTAIQSWEGPN